MDQYTIEIVSEELAPSIQWGSVLHGVLMENLPEPWPDDLHKNKIRPLSQWVENKSADRFIWHINSLQDDLSLEIDTMFERKKEFVMKHGNIILKTDGIRKKHSAAEDYLNSYFLEDDAYQGIYMTFRTPATHKTGGQYAAFPSVELIAGNLRMRLCAIAPDFALADDNAFEQVVQHTRIQRYKLESARFQLEGTGMIGYTGRLELRFYGSDPVNRLAGALFGFADWSGVGIKTALGMGGCTTNPIERKKE